MPFCVRNSNQHQPTPPDTFEELVEFINYLIGLKEEVFTQISGYRADLVQRIAAHFDTNYCDWSDIPSVSLNPFTMIYITRSGEIRRDPIDCKSKVIIYAKRPIVNH